MAYNSIVADYKSFWERKFSELEADKKFLKHFKRFSNDEQRFDLLLIMHNDEADETHLNTDASEDKANAVSEQFKRAHNLILDAGHDEFNTEVDACVAKIM